MKSLVFLTICLVLILDPTLGLYSTSSKVVKLNSGNFQNTVIRSKALWMVEFYSPGCPHCRNLVPEYDKLAEALEGIVNVGAVDTQSDGQVAGPYNIRGVPTIKFFGADKGSPIDYNGGRTASEMLTFALDQAKKIAQSRLQGGSKSSSSGKSSSSSSSSSDAEVIVLTDSEFEEKVMKSNDAWFIEFYAPWCGHCKKLQPEWEALAKKIGKEVKVAKVDATSESRLASRFEIKGYPTIKYFPAGKKSDSSVVDYSGARDTDAMSEWALSMKGVASSASKFLGQLFEKSVWSENCEEFKGLCIIAFLPHIYDSNKEERNGYVALLEESAKKFKSSPLNFLWVQGGDYYEFEESLNLGSGYPALVAVSVSKNVYSIMRSAYTKKNIESYVNGLLAGKEASYKISNLPKIKNVDKWDGEDKKREEVYEDL